MDDALQAAVNKRITLNLLIQGAATHAFFTAHHLVRDRLDAIDPRLTPLYDKGAVSGYLNYWLGDFSLVLGPPYLFWSRLGKADNVFRHNRLMVEHGREMAYASKRHAVARAREKGVWTIVGAHYVQGVFLLIRLLSRERHLREELAEVAVDAVETIWGIDRSRVRGELTFAVEMGTPLPPTTFADRTISNGVVGYSGVLRDDDGGLFVGAKAITWVLLAHELVKGVAELVCLEGMGKLTDAEYEYAVNNADRLSLENWYIQAGGELWRRLLAVAPRDRSLAMCLRQISTLPYEELDVLTRAIASRSPDAADRLSDLQ